VYSGKLILATIYFRRVEIDDNSYAAAPTQGSKDVTPPAPAAHNHGVNKGGWGRGGDAAAAGDTGDKQLGSCAAGKMKYAAYVYSGN
jgi:hypothetical protein